MLYINHCTQIHINSILYFIYIISINLNVSKNVGFI